MRSDTAVRASLACLLIFFGRMTPLSAGSEGSGATSPESAAPDLEALLARCRSCSVTLTNREIVRGHLVDLHEDRMEIESRQKVFGRDGSPFAAAEVHTQRASIAYDSVSAIRCGDPTWNGALAGLLVASVPPMLFILSMGGGEGESDVAGAAAFSLGIFGSIGTVVGYLLDRSVNGPLDVAPETLKSLGREEPRAP